MSDKLRRNRLLQDIISDLSEDPNEVEIYKKPSVRSAIVELCPLLGNKVFTKRKLKDIIEAAFPELEPVDMGNLEVSISRAADILECIQKEEFNVYRYIQDK